MGDMGDFWKAEREDAKVRRRKRKHDIYALLCSAGVRYSAHNDGHHLIIRSHNGTYDLWPASGKWRNRQTNKIRMDFRALIKRVESEGQP